MISSLSVIRKLVSKTLAPGSQLQSMPNIHQNLYMQRTVFKKRQENCDGPPDFLAAPDNPNHYYERISAE
ncbi:hypothetical protein SERLA73DRAFT_80862 [Serpula lacrymans var. lacrymans S7.3]|uniref:Uncharacterized protein n=1 Tax=Serpula lacrymans var. lacrymans (strain S7.3) TaxID=936435 RepID=F8QKE2_SERL3|nr:hypothetical protein SERLA73DRAFT_80862 [Serpula lacrymans var. lacrymans S7.3]